MTAVSGLMKIKLRVIWIPALSAEVKTATATRDVLATEREAKTATTAIDILTLEREVTVG